MLIIYFSAKHHTEKAARQIAEITQAELFELQAVKPYSQADLYYQNPTCRANVEQRSPQTRVDFMQLPNIQGHDTLFIGYPIWWDSAPKVIWNMVEQLDLQDKTVIPFCTSGGSSIDNSVRELKSLNPTATWKKGIRIDMSSNQIQLRSQIERTLRAV